MKLKINDPRRINAQVIHKIHKNQKSPMIFAS